MQYLTYSEYSNIGGTLDATAFERNIKRVNGIVDNATSCRIQNMRTVPDQVKELCRDLAEYFASYPTTEKTISSKSQSAGNVSESESYAVKSTAEQAEDIDNMLCDYLLSISDDNGTPLLYRGYGR